jgi:ribosomal protein L40E
MRTLVDPPPALRCEVCNGELRLKKIEQDTSLTEFDITTFVCTKCGHEESHRATRDRHSAPRASEKPPANME